MTEYWQWACPKCGKTLGKYKLEQEAWLAAEQHASEYRHRGRPDVMIEVRR